MSVSPDPTGLNTLAARGAFLQLELDRLRQSLVAVAGLGIGSGWASLIGKTVFVQLRRGASAISVAGARKQSAELLRSHPLRGKLLSADPTGIWLQPAVSKAGEYGPTFIPFSAIASASTRTVGGARQMPDLDSS